MKGSINLADVKKKKTLKREAGNRKQKSKSNKSKVWIRFFAICLVLYALVNVVSQRIEIAKAEKLAEETSAKITAAKQENDEYTRILNENDEAAYMERIAIERLGYAYPNERRFYIVDAD